MPATTRERNAIVSHTIGKTGLFVLRTVRGSVRVRATDSEEVRVEARYAFPAQQAAEDPEQDGVLRVTRQPGQLRIEADDTAGDLMHTLGRILGGGRPRIDFDVEVPRRASMQLSSVSANLDIAGLAGDQQIRTVSGDVAMNEVGGTVNLQSVSGDALLSGSEVDLRATTTSGDLSAQVDRFRIARVRTVSGDIRLSGAFDAGQNHSVESISGDLEVAPQNGLTASMTSISGSLHSELPHRRESGRGRRSVTVGDGAASLTFRTMSGDLSLAAQPDSASWDERTPSTAGSATSSPPAAADAPAAAVSSADEPGPVTQAFGADHHLDVLRALERGDIDVDSAARLLEGLPYD